MTILLAILIAKEKAKITGWIGIIFALIAGVLLSYAESSSGITIGSWVLFALLIFAAWGIQGFIISYANRTMKAESIFFYMTLTGIILIPVALIMTDFSQTINWGFSCPYLAAPIQILNAFGALFLVYAFRYGKAIIVSPLTNAGAPVITIIISLILYKTLPNYYKCYRNGFGDNCSPSNVYYRRISGNRIKISRRIIMKKGSNKHLYRIISFLLMMVAINFAYTKR